MTVPLVLAAMGLGLVGRREARPWRSRPRRISGRRISGRPTTGAAAAGLGIAVTFVIGGVLGVSLGVAVAVATVRLIPRLEPAAARRRRQRRAAELPLTLDLLGVCLRAGMPLVAALETVADALAGPFSDDLRIVAGLQRLGAAPATAWAELASDPDLAPVCRAVARSAESGSRLAAAFDRLAADRRSALTSAGLARARSAGVVAMAPLGLCFLPAFLLAGLAPVVIAVLGAIL